MENRFLIPFVGLVTLHSERMLLWCTCSWKQKWQSVKFLAAKTRVASLRKQTIPRLELLSALLLARLMISISQSLENELQFLQPRYFTNSKVALFLDTRCRQRLETLCAESSN